MANSADPDQFRSQLIWIYTVCKGKVYPGSAGQGLKQRILEKLADYAAVSGNRNRAYFHCFLTD